MIQMTESIDKATAQAGKWAEREREGSLITLPVLLSKHMPSNSDYPLTTHWQTFCRACILSGHLRPFKLHATQRQQRERWAREPCALSPFPGQRNNCWIRQRTCSHWNAALSHSLSLVAGWLGDWLRLLARCCQ